MRRSIDIRKRKRILLNELNQKHVKLLILLIIILLICCSFYFFFVQDIFIKNNLEKDILNFMHFNQGVPFSLNKIVLFSSATAEAGSVNHQLSLNISQFCDIGIYLNNEEKEENTIQSLYINDIVISSPELGTPYIYVKNINDFGKCSFKDENKIQDSFYFNIVDLDKQISEKEFILLQRESNKL